MDHSKHLTVALEAAKKAEEIILKHYSDGVDVITKDDKTPVTIADKEAEDIIITTIKEHFPDHGFLGEETGEHESNSEYTWIIDPIDGTKNFILGLPLFSTLIALQKNDEIIVGVSNLPGMKECMYAERGKGAYMNGKEIHVRDTEKVGDAFFLHQGISKLSTTHWADAAHKLAKDCWYERCYGDAYNYHVVASGRSDIVIEVGTAIWDVAPMVVIVEEAGGRVTDLEGNPIRRGLHSIVATNGKIHDEVLSYFA